MLSAYWESEPITDVHFLIEADRFCRFLRSQDGLPQPAREALAREGATVAAKLTASRPMAGQLRR